MMTTTLLIRQDKMLNVVERDLGLINKTFQIMSSEAELKLLKDIKYLLLDNIAKKIRFAFYDINNKDDVSYQYVYRNTGSVEKEHLPDTRDDFFGENLAFDVFIDFNDNFLKLDSLNKNILLQNTEYDWFV